MKRHRVPGTSSRTVFVVPAIPDDAPEQIKNALAVRNVATTTGVCPSCSGTFSRTVVDDAGIRHLVMEHAEGCPALLEGGAA